MPSNNRNQQLKKMISLLAEKMEERGHDAHIIKFTRSTRFGLTVFHPIDDFWKQFFHYMYNTKTLSTPISKERVRAMSNLINFRAKFVFITEKKKRKKRAKVVVSEKAE